MEEKANKQNSPSNTEKRPAKKPYYKKRYQPQPQKKKFWNVDKIVSLSAMSIALFTLVVLLYQSHILNKQYELTVKQQKASVLPRLMLASSFSDNSYEIFLQNKGLGPAFIKGLYVKEKDSVHMLVSVKNYYDLNNPDNSTNYYFESGIIPGLVVSPGETLELLSVQDSSQKVRPVSKFFQKYFSGYRSSVFFVEYESVFGETWVVESSFSHFTKEEYGDFEIHYDLVE